MHPAIEQSEQQLRHLGRRARTSAGEAVRPHEHRGAHHVGRQRRADGMRPPEHGMARELGERVRGQLLDHASPEAGREPISGQSLRDIAVDHRARRRHARPGCRGELDPRAIARDPGDVVGREAEPVDPQAVWSTPLVQPGELIFLSEADVSRLALSDLEILAAVEDALRAQGLGAARLEPRVHLEPDPALRGHFNVLRGYLAPLELAGVKVVGDYLDNHERGLPSELGLLTLFDAQTGMPVAIVAAAQLTDMRTGALTALGAKYLARPGSRVLGHVGARGTAYWNVRLLDHLFDFDEVRVHSLRPASREAFARRLEEDLGKPVRVAESWVDCLRGADVMVEASRLERPQPLLETRWVEPGCLVVPYGTMSRGHSERCVHTSKRDASARRRSMASSVRSSSATARAGSRTRSGSCFGTAASPSAISRSATPSSRRRAASASAAN